MSLPVPPGSPNCARTSFLWVPVSSPRYSAFVTLWTLGEVSSIPGSASRVPNPNPMSFSASFFIELIIEMPMTSTTKEATPPTSQ
jgi:hypothetical protein